MDLETIKELRTRKPYVKGWLSGTHSLPAGKAQLGFINARGQQVGPFFGCKDYIHEFLDYAINGMPRSGWYDPSTRPMDLRRLRLGVSVGRDTDKGNQHICNVVNFLNEIEKAQGFRPTAPRYGGVPPQDVYNSHGPETWVLRGDRRWMHASPLISFYCMCVRMGFDYDNSGWDAFLEKGEISTSPNDRIYAHQSNAFWRKLIGTPVEEIFGPNRKMNFPAKVRVGHGTGFLWMSKNNYSIKYPHWKKLR